MKDRLVEIIRGGNGRLLTREYLQARTLEFLQDGSAFETWSFVGGTALRFLFALPRFSEDLDFSLTHPGAPDHFLDHVRRIKGRFSAEGYVTEIKGHPEKAVKSAFIKFPGLLHELGLSPMASETLSIQIEVDTLPPPGAVHTTSTVRRHVMVRLQHHDRASLLAGKIHAILSRPYAKGRDYHDLLWYLSDPQWPEPNLALLEGSLGQSQGSGGANRAIEWRSLIRKKILQTPWDQVMKDVGPFLESERMAGLLTREGLLALVG